MGHTWCRGAGAGPLSSGHFSSATADRLRMNSMALAAPAAKSSTSFSALSTVQAACTHSIWQCQATADMTYTASQSVSQHTLIISAEPNNPSTKLLQ